MAEDTTPTPADPATTTTTPDTATVTTADAGTPDTSTTNPDAGTPDATPVAPPESALPPIVPPAPIVIPAIPEKTYNRMWMSQCQIAAPEPGKPAQAAFELVPYDPDTNAVEQDRTTYVRFNTPDIFADAEEFSVVKRAMGAFLIAVAGLYPVKHLSAQATDLTNMLDQLRQELANATEQKDQANRLPDSNIAKKYNMMQADERITLATAQITSQQTTLDDVNTKLTAAKAMLQA